MDPVPENEPQAKVVVYNEAERKKILNEVKESVMEKLLERLEAVIVVDVERIKREEAAQEKFDEYRSLYKQLVRKEVEEESKVDLCHFFCCGLVFVFLASLIWSMFKVYQFYH